MSSKKLLRSAGGGGPSQSDDFSGGGSGVAPNIWPLTPWSDESVDSRCALA